jgi:hypothetical protein
MADVHPVHPIGQFLHYLSVELGYVPLGQLDANKHPPLYK